jgi:hypothetical protein
MHGATPNFYIALVRWHHRLCAALTLGRPRGRQPDAARMYDHGNTAGVGPTPSGGSVARMWHSGCQWQLPSHLRLRTWQWVRKLASSLGRPRRKPRPGPSEPCGSREPPAATGQRRHWQWQPGTATGTAGRRRERPGRRRAPDAPMRTNGMSWRRRLQWPRPACAGAARTLARARSGPARGRGPDPGPLSRAVRTRAAGAGQPARARPRRLAAALAA